MNTVEKQWVVREVDQAEVDALQKKLNIDTIFCKLLVSRGIKNYEDAKNYFRPSLDRLHDPFLMKGMDKAIERIDTALKNNEKILVWGDYDVDGTTAACLLYLFLSERTELVNYYIPDRYKEGYGISKIGIDWAKENGYGLVIALDCGIKEVDNIDYANSLDIDFVICDHHLPGEKLPDSIAILDPKQPGCNYPFKELSGCGLGFKLIQGIVQKEGRSQDYLRAYLDLVAVSTCCDIVPMVDENRILVHFGLEVLNNSPRIGLSALIDASGVKRTQVDEQTGEVTSNTLTVSDIVFGLGPRINAAGRVDSARQAVELLISKNEEEAKQKAAVLNENNSKRVVLDKEITEEAIEYVLNDPELMKAKSLVLFNKKWHKGVIGIVASRLIERFYKPTILLTESNGLATGSARSVDGFDIHRAIESCDSLLIAYGGHKYAAGLSLDPENIIKFRAKFEKIVSGSIDRDSMNPKIKIDATLDFNQITPSFYKLLKQFAPFGPGNFKPFFVARNVTDTGYSRVVGEKHLKLAVKQSDDKIFYGIAFSKGDYYDNMASKNTFDICYSLRENHWKGRTSLELDVKDIKFQ